MPHPAPDDGFEDFYRSSAPRLVGAVWVLTGDLHLAEDVVQEAFVRCADRWPRVRHYERPEAWVRHVALNLARSALRRARRQLAAWVRHGPPDDAPDLSPDQVAVRAALAGLPRHYRETLVLHYLLDLSVEQIAAETRTPTGTVKARLARGREALAGRFAADREEAR